MGKFKESPWIGFTELAGNRYRYVSADMTVCVLVYREHLREGSNILTAVREGGRGAASLRPGVSPGL
jgi:hypothetical protein